MTRSHVKPRRTGRLMTAAAWAAATALLTASPAASFNARLERVAGATRYETAFALSCCGDGSVTGIRNSPTVVVTSGEVFADALAASYLAGQGNSLMLLTATDTLPATIKRELENRANGNFGNMQRVYVVGNTAHVTANAFEEIRAAANKFNGPRPVERIAGGDDYATASAVARFPGMRVGSLLGRGRTAIVASGERFPDGLAASALSYGQQFPLLLTRQGDLPSVTRDALTSLGIQHVLVAGGEVAVSTAVEQAVQDLGMTTERLAGANRQETAIRLADFAVERLTWPANRFALARGDDFPDALVGGAHAGYKDLPILLTGTPTDLHDTTRQYLRANRERLTSGFVYGGTAAVSEAVRLEAEALTRP